MRVVILPIISFPRLWSESEWLQYWRMVDVWVRRHPDAFVYLVTPETADTLPEHPRIHYVVEKWEDLFYDKNACAGATFLELFNPRKGKYVVDAVLSGRVIAGPQIARMLWDFRCDDGMIPLFIRELKTVDFGRAHQVVTDLEIMGRTLGYVAGTPLFDTDLEKQTAFEAASRYLQPVYLKKLWEKALVNPVGFDCSGILEATKDVKKRDKFTVFFGGRLNQGSKKSATAVEIMERFFAFGRDVSVVACSPSSKRHKDFLDQYSALEVFAKVPQNEFWKRAAACHAFLSFSRVEGFTVGFLEMLYVGLVGVVPRRPWVKALLQEHYDSYPFLHSSDEEALTHLRFIYENLDKAREMVAHIPPFLKTKYDSWDVCEREYQIIQAAVNKGRKTYLHSPANVQLIKDVLPYMGERFTLTEMWAGLAKAGVAYKVDMPPRRGQISKWAIHQWLVRNGYRDTCDTAVPTYVKEM